MAQAVRLRLPKRQVFLFLLVLVTPCLLLTGLGLRLQQQERSLALRRTEEEHRRQLSRFRSDLLSTLERMRHQGLGVVGTIRDGKLVLPFDAEPHAKRFRQNLKGTGFGVRIARAEHEELIDRRLDQAAQQYRAAFTASSPPWQRAYASLLLGRTFQKAAQLTEARKQFRNVLLASSDVTDEYGIPLLLYAAPALLEMGDAKSEVVQLLRTLAGDPAHLGPAALHRIRDLATQAVVTDLLPSLDRLIAQRVRDEALQADLPRLLDRLQGEEPVWIPYGDPVSLVTLARRADRKEPLLLAVSADPRIVQGKEGELLGEGFPGVCVVFPKINPQNGVTSGAFLIASLALVMTLTLFAGFLLWRDLRRDARLAELRSHFVSSVSHELRTPLTSIRMFTESMRLDDEMDAETRAAYLDTVLHESERLSRLVDNMLHFARIEQGRAAYDLRPALLDGVIESAVRGISRPAAQSGFRLDVEVASGLPPVLADRDALQQAILNLLGNAMKYSGTSRDIGLKLERENGNAAIRVIDHGVGIAPEEQARIFERYYRAATPENQQIPGTGLGLTLVEHIATAHGGSASVKSSPQEGSTFTITIPLEHP